jgi:hypothetical protein
VITAFEVFRSRWQCSLKAAVRAAIIYLLTAMYGLSAVGLGIPTPTKSQGAEAYPCQHGSCGCRSAEQCWKSCCCHTDEEKLAWAARNGVTPPAYVVVAVQRKCGSRSCCASTTRSCCAKSQAGGSCEHAPASHIIRVKWVSVIDAARCRGESATWMNVVISLPADFFASDLNPLLRLCWLTCPPRQQFLSLAIAPPEPPPRVLTAMCDV